MNLNCIVLRQAALVCIVALCKAVVTRWQELDSCRWWTVAHTGGRLLELPKVQPSACLGIPSVPGFSSLCAVVSWLHCTENAQGTLLC